VRAVAISVVISGLFMISPGRSFGAVLINVLIFGIPFGLTIVAMTITRLTEFKLPSFILTVLAKTVLFAGAALLSFSFSFYTANWMLGGLSPLDPDNLRRTQELVTSGGFTAAIGFTMVAVFLVSAVLAVSQKLGPGVMWNWLIGYYHQPREEERCFMFLDIKDSTTLAEKQGNLRFSALVRDFMEDLTYPVINTGGEVSHYIGDEAVLTGRANKGGRRANVVRCFYLMQDRVQARQERYLSRYGLVPEFKAGIHFGTVVATEVGQIKSEIVFHGDVLNSTARIQSLCAQEGALLLASEEALGQIADQADYEVTHLGPRTLKGRVEPIRIAKIERIGK